MDVASLKRDRSGRLVCRANVGRDEDYTIDSDSEFDDDGCENSSDEDIDILLNGTIAQRQKLMLNRQVPCGKGKESSSEDEFEKEMNNELDDTMRQIEASNQGDKTGKVEATKEKEANFYEADYFDSDTDEEGTSEEKKGRKHRMLTNDELLYDPNMDSEDQQWVDNQRRKCHLKLQKKGVAKTGEPALPASDAVLNCPACMATLCRDCQRHHLYKNQYRAMFVVNCRVVKDELLSFPKNKGKKKSKGKNSAKAVAVKQETSETDKADELEKYNPVRCDTCSTEVAVYDKDEVYHFFNVLASYT